MERFRTVCRKLLYPKPWLVLLLALVSGTLLAWIFLRGLNNTPLAYGAYLLSFYALITVCAAAGRGIALVQRQLNDVPLASRYRGDAYFRVRTSLILSFSLNLCYAGVKIGTALLYSSFWNGALGGYYALLCVIRLYLLGKTGAALPPERQQIVRRRTGWMLLALNLVLSWISYQIVQTGQGYHYPGTLIYAAAAYAFYALSLAISQVVQYRKFRSPVLSAAKSVNLTCALVTMFSLETAMRNAFGGSGSDSLVFWGYMLPATAAAVCTSVLLIALRMIRRPLSVSNRSKSRGGFYCDPYSCRRGRCQAEPDRLHLPE